MSRARYAGCNSTSTMSGPEARKASFAPLVAPGTRVLILGSLPGERSLAEGRYYAHPQNQFCRLGECAWS